MKIRLTENDIRSTIEEVVSGFLKEHQGPEGGYADYDYEDISWQSVYEQALDYLEGGGRAESARDLMSQLGFRTETFSERDYETAYDACEDAITQYNQDNGIYQDEFFENRLRNSIKQAICESIYDGEKNPYEQGNSWYDEEDYDGNVGKPGMIRSYDVGTMYMSDAEIMAEENGYDNVVDFLRFYAEEVLYYAPWIWIKKGSGYGHNGSTVFEADDIVDGHLVCKEIWDQIMFDAYPPTGGNGGTGGMMA